MLEGTVIVDELDKTPARVVVSPDFINSRLGMKISLEDMISILNRLKFDVEAANGLLILKRQLVVKILKLKKIS